MKDLTFLVSWGKNKETAWSGTNFSLYQSLSQYYNVKDVDLSRMRMNRWLRAFLQRILRFDGNTIEYHQRHFLGRKLKDVDGNVLQFSEVLYNEANRHTYLYVDLTVSYVNYLRNSNPKVFSVSAFQNTNACVFEKRGKEQDQYMNTCSGVFTMGHWLCNWLVERGLPSDRIHAVGGGTNVDPRLIKPQTKSHNKILFIGKDFTRKGGYITYEAFKLLRAEGHNVELYIIGPSKNPIENPVDGYHFIGQITFEDEAKYYNMCDVFCMPSYFEAYGLVFVEALTFGLPCIGRNCYEMPFFIEDGKTGRLLNNDDPRELASLIFETLENDSYTQNVLSNHRQYIKDYSWSEVAKRISEVIG